MSAGKARAKEGLDKDLFAQIVAQTSECGGFSTVLADLLHEQPLDKKSDLLAPAYAPYRLGLAQKLVEGPKLKASAGHRFSALVQPCEEWEETLMLAVHVKAPGGTGGQVLLNPGPAYTVTAADTAIIVCAKDKVAAAVKDIEKGVTVPINSKDADSGLGTTGSTTYGFRSLTAPMALRDAHIRSVADVCPDGGHVLVGCNLEVCGILPQLVKNLRRDYYPHRKIVLMDPTEPREDVWQRIATFPDVYVLLGNMTEVADLQRAGADRAHSVILLSPWNEEQKKGKKSKKGDAAPTPYTSIMQVQMILKSELQSTVPTVLCVGKNHKGSAKELTPAQRELQTINHPLHASSLMVTYDLFDYWLAKAFSTKKGLLGEVIEQLIRGVVQSVPASRLQTLVAAQQPPPLSPTSSASSSQSSVSDVTKPLTFGELIRWAGTKGFLPLGYYHWTGSDAGSYVHTHPGRECVVPDGDNVLLLWPRGETPISLPLPSADTGAAADELARTRAESSFDMDYISLPKPGGEIAHAPAPAPSSSSSSSSSTLARPPPSLALPPSLAPPPTLQRPTAPAPAAASVDSPPPPPPRDDGNDDGLSPPPPLAAPVGTGVSLAGFSPRSPPAATSPRVAVPPRPGASSPRAGPEVSPRSPPPAVSPRLPPPPVSPRAPPSVLPPAVTPRSPPPPVSPREPPPPVSPREPQSASVPPAAPPRDPPPPSAPPAAPPRDSPPTPAPPAAPPRDPPATATAPLAQPGVQRPPALKPPPSLAPPPSLKAPPALTIPPPASTTTTTTPSTTIAADETRAIPSFATVRRPTTKNRRAITSLHRTISSSTLSRLQQQEDAEAARQQQASHASVAASEQRPVSPRASAPPASRPPVFSPSPSSATSSLPPVFTPPPRFTPAPAATMTKTTPGRSAPASPALAPPPALALPPTLAPPPALSPPPSSSTPSPQSSAASAAMAFTPNASWMTLGTNPYPSLRGATIPSPVSLSTPPPPSLRTPPPSLTTPPPPSLHTP